MNYIILDDELKRISDLDAEKVIDPLTVEDSETGEHTLTFSYPVAETGDIVEGGQIILIKDADGDFQPFRVIESRLSLRGENVLNVRCEHLFYELANGLPQSYAVLNYTAAQALTLALTDVRWQVGTIDASITDQVDLSGSFDNPLKILRKIASDYSARLKFRATVGTTEITGLYVDMLEVDFEFSGQRFEFGHNLQGIDVNIDYSQVFTALTGIVPGATTDPITEEAIPLTFASAVWAIADGDPADKPAVQTWVGNEAARLLYGIYNPDTGVMDHRFGIYDSGAAQTAETLLAATWLIGERYHFAPKVNIEAKVADLNCVKIVDVTTGATVILDDSKIRVGNLCYVIAREQGLYAAADVRIIRIERYLKEPEKTVVILGDALFAGSDFLRELQEEVDNKTRRRAQAPDRGPGAAVTIASADTSIAPEYADIIVPAAATNFELYMAQALADLPAEGGQILILEGEYVYSSQMEITLNNVTITGQGEGTVIKLADNRTAATVGFYAIDKKGVKISDLVLDGNSGNQTHAFLDGIEFDLSRLRSHWAWQDPDIFNATNPQNNQLGWSFHVTTAQKVSKFRLLFGESGNKTVYFYSGTAGPPATNVTLVTSQVINCVANQWTEVTLSTPIDLEPISVSNTIYLIMTYAANGADSWVSLKADMSQSQFSNSITLREVVRSTGGQGTPPDADTDATFAVDFELLGDDDLNSEFVLRNVTAKNYTRDGFEAKEPLNAEIVGCRFNGNDIGIRLSSSDYVGSKNIRVQGNELNENTAAGIYVSTGEDILIQNNSVIGNVDIGMFLYGIKSSSIVGNTCRQSGDDSIFTLAGIALVVSDGNTISGNVSSENNYWGISLVGSDYNLLSNNACSDNISASGIHLTDNSVYNTVQSNKCQGNYLYGIRIDAGSNNNQVTNNDLYGNTAGGLLNNGTGTITAAGNRT